VADFCTIAFAEGKLTDDPANRCAHKAIKQELRGKGTSDPTGWQILQPPANDVCLADLAV
jgi:hypothetical protein